MTLDPRTEGRELLRLEEIHEEVLDEIEREARRREMGDEHLRETELAEWASERERRRWREQEPVL